MPRKRQRGGTVPADLMDADISFPLARLFDPFNLDHISEKKRMEEFEHRDLAHIKHYKAAVKIFGGPLSRKRVMIAPPMETPLKHRLGLYMDKKEPPPAPVLNTPLQKQIPAEKPIPEELVIARQAREREDNYKSWFKERQKFRNDLENMGLNMDWLSKKPNKTVLEQRVLRKLKEDEGRKHSEEDEDLETPEPVDREYTSDSDASTLPNLKVPAPLGLKILENHLKEQKMRLMDLFTSVDKNKDWKISREEFVKACTERDIPISRGLLEDMLITLDMNLDDELDYKEMARGMELARKEKREDRRKELSRESTAVSRNSGSVVRSATSSQQPQRQPSFKLATDDADRRSGKTAVSPKLSDKTLDTSKQTMSSSKSRKTGSPDKSENGKLHPSSSSPSKGTLKSEPAGVRVASRSDNNRTISPNYLEPPDPDVRLEQLILPTDEAMLDLRKRDREGLKGYNAKWEATPGTIMTGSKAIDNHCMNSTLVGEVGEMVDKFRQKRLQEYYNIVHLCEANDVALSKNLLEKVLLYPPDYPHSDIKKLRHPDSAPLVSSHFADKPKRPRTPIEEKHKDKVRRSKSGKLLIDSRHKYPMHKTVAPDGYKENLSTGRAVIRRRVDCWMTFEEYERLTRHLAIRYSHLHGNKALNVYWPGHLLEKIRLCMPPYDKQPTRDKEMAIYKRVHRTPAVNYGYEAVDMWPLNDSMYSQIGIHDHFKNKTII